MCCRNFGWALSGELEVVMRDCERQSVVWGAEQTGRSVCALLRQHTLGASIAFAGDDPVLRCRALPCLDARLKGQVISYHPMLNPPDHYADAQIDRYLSPEFPMNNWDEMPIKSGGSSSLHHGWPVLASGGA